MSISQPARLRRRVIEYHGEIETESHWWESCKIYGSNKTAHCEVAMVEERYTPKLRVTEDNKHKKTHQQLTPPKRPWWHRRQHSNPSRTRTVHPSYWNDDMFHRHHPQQNRHIHIWKCAYNSIHSVFHRGRQTPDVVSALMWDKVKGRSREKGHRRLQPDRTRWVHHTSESILPLFIPLSPPLGPRVAAPPTTTTTDINLVHIAHEFYPFVPSSCFCLSTCFTCPFFISNERAPPRVRLTEKRQSGWMGLEGWTDE